MNGPISLNEPTQTLTAANAAVFELPVLLTDLHSSTRGIDRESTKTRLGQWGPNEVAGEKPPHWYAQLALAFHVPFNYLLMALALVDFLTHDLRGAIVISIMVVLSGLLRFWQEFRSGRAAEQLRALVHTTATVCRPRGDSQEGFGQEETPIRELVPGDVVHLSAGDLVPADLRILTAKDLFISQSTLTGEAMPVEKLEIPGSDAKARLEKKLSPLELPNICFMGTSVVSGTAQCVVFATGPRTWFGSLAKDVTGRRATTAFDKGVSGVSRLLLTFMAVMVPIVILINGFTKHDWYEAFLFGVAVAVGLTPEMLPMIVTTNLAGGALAMARRKVVVKRLKAIQNFGAIDILCTDKTGTLTQDKVVLIKHLDVEGNENDETFEYAFLNSYFQTGLKNLLDHAVLEYGDHAKSDALVKRYLKRDEVPFDFHRRRMSVVVHEAFHGQDLLICKGAVEEITAICTTARIGGKDVPLDDKLRAQAAQLWADQNEDGLRIIGVAIKLVDSVAQKTYGIADESNLTLIGFIAFLDPPKETAAPALAELGKLGISVKILTGDNELVTAKVCRDVGLPKPRILLGRRVEELADAELEVEAEKTDVFAKLTPPQKARIIAALKRKGHTVGFLGDGINDAPALREADAGVSVDTATDIARESADIILLEKSLLVLADGVRLGRQTYGNTIKYVKMAASSNFGNTFSVLAASIWLPFLPMLAIHMLIQNLLYDISQVGIPFDRMDEEYLEKPRKWLINDLGRFMICIGPISSIFDLTTFAVMYWVFQAQDPNDQYQQSLFQSGWFVEGLLSQTLIIHMIRTSKVPFLQSTAATPLVLLTALVMAVGVLIPFTAIGEAVGLVPLPPAYFLWLAGTLLCYCTLTQFVKRWYIRRFGNWL